MGRSSSHRRSTFLDKNRQVTYIQILGGPPIGNDRRIALRRYRGWIGIESQALIRQVGNMVDRQHQLSERRPIEKGHYKYTWC